MITKAFDLAREMTQRTRKLPRNLKSVLRDWIRWEALADAAIEVIYSSRGTSGFAPLGSHSIQEQPGPKISAGLKRRVKMEEGPDG